MAPPAVIADSSALIALQQVDLLALLESLFGRILIPPAVASEVAPGLPVLPSWIEVRAAKASLDERVLAAGLGEGESQVLQLGLETPDAWLILDDAAARRLASRLGLKKLGTAAVFVEAKRAGLIRAVRPLLDALLGKGFRLSGAGARGAPGGGSRVPRAPAPFARAELIGRALGSRPLQLCADGGRKLSAPCVP